VTVASGTPAFASWNCERANTRAKAVPFFSEGQDSGDVGYERLCSTTTSIPTRSTQVSSTSPAADLAPSGPGVARWTVMSLPTFTYTRVAQPKADRTSRTPSCRAPAISRSSCQTTPSAGACLTKLGSSSISATHTGSIRRGEVNDSSGCPR